MGNVKSKDYELKDRLREGKMLTIEVNIIVII